MKKFILLIYRAVLPEAFQGVLIPPFIRKVIRQAFKSRRLKLIHTAEMEMQAEKWPEAIRCWQDVLKGYGKKAPAGIYIKLSRTHRKHGDLDSAEAMAQQGHQLYPKETKFAVELAEIAVARSQWADAIHYWKIISEALGKNTPVEIYIKSARAHRKHGDLNDAKTVALQGHQHYPKETKLAFELAEIAAARSYWTDAIHYWKIISDTLEENTPVGILIKLARAHREQGDLNTSETVALQGHQRFPEEIKFTLELAEIAAARSQWEKAIQYWKMILETHGKNTPVEIYIKSARAYRNQGNLDAAETVILQGYQHYPEEMKLAVELAEIAGARSQWAEAIQYWQAFLDVHGKNTPVKIYIKLAGAHRKYGDLDRAETVAQQGHKQYPMEMKLAVELAEIAVARSRWNTAIRHWKTILEAHGKNTPVEIYIKLARAYREQGNLGSAETIAQQGHILYPNTMKLYIELAEIAAAREQWEEAIGYWKIILDFSGEKTPANVYIKLYNAYQKQENIAAAEAIIRKGHKQYPKKMEFDIALAELSIARSHWPDAIRHWQSVVDIHGKEAPARIYFKLSGAYRRQGALDAAETVARQGYQHYPDEMKLSIELAEIAVARAQWEEAIRYWQSVLDVHREDTPTGIYIKLTRAYQRQGELQAAKTAAKQGLQRYPKETKLAVELAEIAMAQYDWTEAVTLWQALLECQDRPKLPEVYVNIALAQRKLGDLNTARHTIKSGLSQFPRAAVLLFHSAILENFTPAPENQSIICNFNMRKEESVTIIICVCNAPEQTQRCIESVLKATPPDYKMILIDDASARQTNNMINSLADNHKRISVVRNAQNIGYTRSANKGLQLADTEWVVLLNSDTIVTDNWLQGLFECAYSDPGIRAVGPLSNAAGMQSIPVAYNADGTYPVNLLPPGYTPDDMALLLKKISPKVFPKVPMLNGFCTLIHKPTLHAVGYLDEINFPHGYGEENDLCLRFLKAGHRLAIADHVYVYHEKSSSFGHERRKLLTQQGVKKMLTLWPTYSYKKFRFAVDEIPAMVGTREMTGKEIGLEVRKKGVKQIGEAPK